MKKTTKGSHGNMMAQDIQTERGWKDGPATCCTCCRQGRLSREGPNTMSGYLEHFRGKGAHTICYLVPGLSFKGGIFKEQ